jgi:hypothetical protein
MNNSEIKSKTQYNIMVKKTQYHHHQHKLIIIMYNNKDKVMIKKTKYQILSIILNK